MPLSVFFFFVRRKYFLYYRVMETMSLPKLGNNLTGATPQKKKTWPLCCVIVCTYMNKQFVHGISEPSGEFIDNYVSYRRHKNPKICHRSLDVPYCTQLPMTSSERAWSLPSGSEFDHPTGAFKRGHGDLKDKIRARDDDDD